MDVTTIIQLYVFQDDDADFDDDDNNNKAHNNLPE